jgi:hypothetical protein
VAISYIRYVIGALLGGEFRERLGDGFDECIECPRRGLPQGGFQLCKGLFDRVQVGTVVGQIAQRRASSLNRLPDSRDFVGWQLPAWGATKMPSAMLYGSLGLN